MFSVKSKSYLEIREYLDTVPVIDTHEHYAGISPNISSIFDFFGYSWGDLRNLKLDNGKEITTALRDRNIPYAERYARFEKLYKRADKTAYARAEVAGLKECWGINEISEKTLTELDERLIERNDEFYEPIINRFGIKLKIVDIPNFESFRDLIDGKAQGASKYCRFAFPLRYFHKTSCRNDIVFFEEYAKREFTCLDDYLEAFDSFLKKSVDFGIICMKDQSAYRRPIDYGNPERDKAEKIFNMLINNPSETFNSKETRALDDWLFQYFMRQAGKYDLPVQIHTGHLSGTGNNIFNANAANLMPLLNIHPKVRFDLFHGNWPFMDEYLFIGKNYPNAYLNLCWVQGIDPVYCIELMKRVLVALPHVKLMAFGGDGGNVEMTVGYLILARNNVAYALSEMVDSNWISLQEAKQVAADWFFNNANEFYNLGFERFDL